MSEFKLAIYIYQPHRSGRIWHKVNYKRSLTGSKTDFSFSQKAEEPSLSYYLPIAGGRIIRFIPFPSEIQSVSSRIWTRVAVSISYDDNHYTTATSHIQTRYNYVKNWPCLILLSYLLSQDTLTWFD